MDEMISRSAAIEAIEKHIRTAEEPYQLTYADKVMNHAFEIAASCVYNLSATEPKIIRCKDCKHNPKITWFECPLAHCSETQRPETAWCWKAERWEG